MLDSWASSVAPTCCEGWRFVRIRGRRRSSKDDRAIRVQVLDALSKEGWLGHGTLNVIVQNGVVQLWGFVESKREC